MQTKEFILKSVFVIFFSSILISSPSRVKVAANSFNNDFNNNSSNNFSNFSDKSYEGTNRYETFAFINTYGLDKTSDNTDSLGEAPAETKLNAVKLNETKLDIAKLNVQPQTQSQAQTQIQTQTQTQTPITKSEPLSYSAKSEIIGSKALNANIIDGQDLKSISAGNETKAMSVNTVPIDSSNKSQGANSKNALKIPTYDGSNQACHPKVLYFANGWNGWKYWMVFTPYPNGNDFLENPSIVVSNTGTNWQVPKGLSNPVTPLPDVHGKHNSDPDLVYDQDKNQVELWYRFTLFNKEDRILRMTSSNGINWSKPQLMISFEKRMECFSPAIIIENHEYKMWYVNEDLICMYIESADGVKWSAPVKINFNLTDSFVPWHIDVVHTDLGYEAIFCGAKRKELVLNNRILFWSISKDGQTFGNSKVILSPSSASAAWDNKQIYRSTFVKVAGVYKLFYSAMDKKSRWHIGLSQGTSLDKLNG